MGEIQQGILGGIIKYKDPVDGVVRASGVDILVGGLPAETDDQGNWGIAVDPDTYTLRIQNWPSGVFGCKNASKQVMPGSKVLWNSTLKTGTISGFTKNTTGQPMAPATVKILVNGVWYNMGDSVYPSGVFGPIRILTGTYSFKAQCGMFSQTKYNVTITDGQDTQVIFNM